MTCPACAIQTVETWKQNHVVECVDYSHDILTEGMSDVMVPQQFTDDHHTCVWLEGFMIDPIRDLIRAQALGLASESSTSVATWLADNYLTLPDNQALQASTVIRSYWGWMNLFNTICSDDMEILSVIDVRINGQAAQFGKELWEQLALEEHGYSKLGDQDAPVVITGVDPMTGESIVIDQDSAEAARNIVWLQCLVVGLLKSTLNQFTFMLEHKPTRPSFMSMNADLNFLLWLQGSCEHTI